MILILVCLLMLFNAFLIWAIYQLKQLLKQADANIERVNALLGDDNE